MTFKEKVKYNYINANFAFLKKKTKKMENGPYFTTENAQQLAFDNKIFMARELSVVLTCGKVSECI